MCNFVDNFNSRDVLSWIFVSREIFEVKGKINWLYRLNVIV